MAFVESYCQFLFDSGRWLPQYQHRFYENYILHALGCYSLVPSTARRVGHRLFAETGGTATADKNAFRNEASADDLSWPE